MLVLELTASSMANEPVNAGGDRNEPEDQLPGDASQCTTIPLRPLEDQGQQQGDDNAQAYPSDNRVKTAKTAASQV